MADKTVNELTQATQVTATDLFVLEQNGEAKKLTGQTLENWLLEMAEGKGGIQSIQKVSSSGLTDTYRITFSDTTTFTYQITNGAKGDPGEKTYLWVKYSSEKPSSNADIYDTPDNWIGIYTGPASAAPAGYTQYTWFKIKGETGKPGSASVLNSGVTTYQVSDSGTIIPSGTWLASIPPVSQGKYLWTRTVLTFNTGFPVTSYSVARMGVDGAGSVVSVNNVSPDGNGNVAINAESIGALSLSGGTMNGPVHMNGQTLDGLNSPTASGQAATKGYADRYANASNITSGTLNAARLPTVPVSKGGTGGTTVAAALENLGLTKRYAVAKGSSNALALAAGVITQITLTDLKVNKDNAFSISGGGIKMPAAGTVMVLASVYFTSPSTSAPSNVGPYVKKNGEEIAGQLTYAELMTTASLAPFLVDVNADDILTLHARSGPAAGSCAPNGGATALTVIYL